ncbi:CDC23 isoform 3 [Pan troglodytes]|uniref:CDC23 isoform 3 n=1 Tax=Pan troglodytes TaxID=9598 RepID=A0A2J8LRC0_PANTR|nr:CDC23 isoform 3 [Pan troglodytes]
MAASTSIVPVAVTAAVAPVLSINSDFSDLREIKKQLLLIAGLTRERGLLHSSKWSAELAFSLPALPLAELQPPPPITEMPRIWMPIPWPRPTLTLKSMIGRHISCMAAIARKPIFCICIPDIW